MNHFLSINDLSRDDALYLLAEAARLKNEIKEDSASQMELLRGKTLAMVFEKPSLRTRVSFDVGMFQMGGHAITLAPNEIGLGSAKASPMSRAF
jgi:ornithine carbamoyltransferase